MTQQLDSILLPPINEFVMPWVAGNWYISQPAYGTSRTSLAAVAGRLYAIPIYIPQLTQIASIGLNLQSLSAANNLRLGLYTDSGGYPAARQFDSGNISTATTGDKTYAPSWTPSYIGWHWLAALFSGTPSPMCNSNSGTVQLLGADSATDIVAHNFLYTTFAFAALPDPFPGSPTYSTNQPWDVCLKI